MIRIGTVMILAGMFFGCGNFTDTPVLQQQDSISGCGGFPRVVGPFLAPDPSYCAAEMLYWAYEASTETLTLSDTRVLLNCCGDHSFTVEEQDGVYVFTEKDAPEGGGARCACMCVYDFSIEVQGIPAGNIPARIERNVTDWPEGSGLVLEADLDLDQGSGSIVIDETDVGPWCSEE